MQSCRLTVRSDELVFENACVRASSRNTADQQIGARRCARRSDPCAARSIERFETGNFTKVSAVAVVQGALQIERRAPVQCGAARKYLYRTAVRELADDNALGATERAGQPPRRKRDATPIVRAERNKRRGIYELVGRGRLCATLTSLADGLEQREREHLDLSWATRAGSGDNALAAS